MAGLFDFGNIANMADPLNISGQASGDVAKNLYDPARIISPDKPESAVAAQANFVKDTAIPDANVGDIDPLTGAKKKASSLLGG